MLILVVLFAAASVLLLAISLDLISLPNSEVRGRVKNLAEPKVDKRAAKAARSVTSQHGMLSYFTPGSMLKKIERNMVLAGRPEGWSQDRIILLKPTGAIVGSLLAALFIADSGSFLMIVFGFGMIVLGYFTPDLLIYNLAIKRQGQIQKDLPDALDQIVIALEAGTSFEAALRRVGDRSTGPFAEEVVRLIQDISLGMSRREAYMAMASRTTVEELKGFCKAIVQAEEYGVSVASVVRTQASEMRRGRRMRAEAKAQQVPVKILIPLMLLILPVLFIFVMGPPLVNAFASS